MPVPIKKDKIVRTSTKERVYKMLRGWIADGTLQPGERLSDREIAEHFAVSRTPVREALQMLAEQKFVTILPSSGTFVAPVDRGEMVQLYTLLGGLQALAMEMGFSRITADDTTRLREFNAAFRQASDAGDVSEANRAHAAFHRAVAEISGSTHLAGFTDTLMMLAFRGENLFLKSACRRLKSGEQHEAIIDALEQGDLPTAQALMKENWDSSFWEACDAGKKETEA